MMVSTGCACSVLLIFFLYFNVVQHNIHPLLYLAGVLMLVNAGYSDLNHQNVKSWRFFINLVTRHFVYMCHCKIQFYDNILKIGRKGQW